MSGSARLNTVGKMPSSSAADSATNSLLSTLMPI
jgi:hypothetical protein